MICDVLKDYTVAPRFLSPFPSVYPGMSLILTLDFFLGFVCCVVSVEQSERASERAKKKKKKKKKEQQQQQQ